MAKRTDCHRPGAIIPANYRYVRSYSLATSSGGWPIPSWGVNCELDLRRIEKDDEGKTVAIHNGEHREDGMCCIVGMLNIAKAKFAATGGTGKCSVCGAHFIYGDVWVHEPTGEHIHIGHECADKYSLLADRSEYELQLGRMKAAAAVEIQKAQNAEEREAFLNKNPGLREALKVNHPIVQDIARKFQEYRSLSEKQVALVFKLQAEANKPAAEQEKTVPAPTGTRQTFRGMVVSVKDQESMYGTVTRMTVKVTTPNGVWLAWGTCPAALLDSVPANSQGRYQNLRGAEVEITALLNPGRDAHFALMKRPVGRVVKLAPEVTAANQQ